jgi:hypothetical protein
MAEIILQFPNQGDVILQDKMSRTMYCKKCEKESHTHRCEYVLLHGSEKNSSMLCPIKGFEPSFKVGYSPQFITDIIPEQLKDGTVWVFYTRICGIEGCGYRLLESKISNKWVVKFTSVDRNYMSLDEFIELDKNKKRKAYIKI